MITDLVLHNYRQYAYTELKFGPGLNVIRGQNNSGKTTILEAIAFALFGPKAIKDTGKSWIRDGEKSGSVTLCIDVGDKVKIHRSNTNASLTVNGKEVTQYRNEANDEIGRLLGISPRMFLLGYNVRQKEIDFFSSLTKGRKKAEIERLLSISRVDNAMSIVAGESKTSRIEMGVLSAQLVNKADLVRELQEIKVDEKRLEAKVAAYEVSIESNATVLESLADKIEPLIEKRLTAVHLDTTKKAAEARRETALKALTTVASSVKETEAQIKHRDEVLKPFLAIKEQLYRKTAWLKDKARQYKDIEEAEARFNMLTKKSRSLQTEADKLLKEIGERNDLQEWLNEREYDKVVEELTQIDKAIASFKETTLRDSIELSTVKDRIEAMEGEEKCPLCGSEIDVAKLLDEAWGSVEYYNGRIASNNLYVAKLDERKTELLKIKNKCEAVSRTIQRAEHLDSQLQRTLEDKEEVDKEAALLASKIPDEREDVEVELKAAMAELDRASKNSDRYHSMTHLEAALAAHEKRRAELLAETNELDKEISGMEAELQKLEGVLQEYHELRAEMDAVSEERTKLLDAKNDTKAMVERMRAVIETKKIRIDEQKILSEKVAALSKLIDTYESDIAVFKNFKKYVGEKVLPKVREVAERLFHEITHNRYSRLVVTEDYDLRVVTHDGAVRSLKSISGSEEDVALLCLRMALSTLAAGTNRTIDFILLDEITASFDNDRTESVVAGVMSLRNLYKQIFWITHKEIEEQFADARIVVSLADQSTAAVEIN